VLFLGESMVSRRQGLLVTAVVVAALYGVSLMMRPLAATNSSNARFNAYVTYFRRQEGYIVEYRDFDGFEDMVDEMYKPVGSPNPQAILPNVFVKSVKVFTLGRDFEGDEVAIMMTPGSLDYPVTVYYDDEKNTLFYIGDAFSSRFFYAARAPDPTATYGYYCTFAAN
jgi:hypothetical protein